MKDAQDAVWHQNSLVAQWVKDLVLSLLWRGFLPWPWNFHLWDTAKKKKKMGSGLVSLPPPLSSSLSIIIVFRIFQGSGLHVCSGCPQMGREVGGRGALDQCVCVCVRVCVRGEVRKRACPGCFHTSPNHLVKSHEK